jgi:hypothetical protein
VIADGLDARMQVARKAAAETLEDAEMGKSEVEAGPCQLHVDCTESCFSSPRAPSRWARSRPIRLCCNVFACGAGDGNRTRTVSLGTVRTHGCVLGALRDSRSRAAWSVPWTPPLMAREWHGVHMQRRVRNRVGERLNKRAVR